LNKTPLNLILVNVKPTSTQEIAIFGEIKNNPSNILINILNATGHKMGLVRESMFCHKINQF